jgi:3D (Asp-Asp-Asp) domain-containing protein
VKGRVQGSGRPATYNHLMLARSLGRKAVVMLVAVGGFVWLYEATMFDPLLVTRLRLVTESDPVPSPAPPGARLAVTATAYCRGQLTSAGVTPRRGVAAADPSLLPLGSVVEIDANDGGFDGVYSILDTGPNIVGRRIDLYFFNCDEALIFGRQSVQLTVIRMGWSPANTARSFTDRLFRRTPTEPRAAEPDPLPSRPLPSTQLGVDVQP